MQSLVAITMLCQCVGYGEINVIGVMIQIIFMSIVRQTQLVEKEKIWITKDNGTPMVANTGQVTCAFPKSKKEVAPSGIIVRCISTLHSLT